MKKILLFLMIISASFIASGQGRSNLMIRNSGYANINELSGGYGLAGATSSYSKYFYGITTTHGYELNFYGLKVNNSLFGGIGSGLLIYKEGFMLPLYADIRFTWNLRKVSPFLSADGGFLVSLKKFNDETRMFVDGGAGIRIKINENLSASLGIGMLVQMGSPDGRDSFINIKMGIAFKAR